ncbi:bacteriocin [Thalassomonas actiniarum]|uniref:Bacteriocin n=1 Tax=Thalassomonas actiniarum TaxID=485447 RepID=A0AAF0C4B0_9GAMM|nr:bacteriocin [Thalassomonas actiniarum]WDD99805.1 bacteriocin [Thalassomonas actiniarum]
MQKLTTDELKNITGGSNGGKGVHPTALTLDDLKNITGGSGGGKGVNPASAAPITPMADSLFPVKKEEGTTP